MLWQSNNTRGTLYPALRRIQMRTNKKSIDNEEYMVDSETPILIQREDHSLVTDPKITERYRTEFEAGPNDVVARNGEYYERRKCGDSLLFRKVAMSGLL